MTKAELISAVNEATGGTKKQTADNVQAVFDALAGAVKDGGRFTYPGFGTFKLKERGARQGRNPQTGASITIAASKTISFKPAPALKDSL